MESIDTILVLATGLFLRLALPIALTIFVIYLLRRLDARWQMEAEQHAAQPLELEKCWEIKNCPPEKLSSCAAYGSDEPCFQVHRLQNGYLRDECLTCEVFERAPILTHAPAHT